MLTIVDINRNRHDELQEWQGAQKELEAMVEATKMLAAKPIWRCAVCGRADKPWIVCWVAPYIVGYTEVAV